MGFSTFDNALDEESHRISEASTFPQHDATSEKKSKPSISQEEEEELKEQIEREKASFRLSLLRGDQDEETAGNFTYIYLFIFHLFIS